jgi:hypothetical protein
VSRGCQLDPKWPSGFQGLTATTAALTASRLRPGGVGDPVDLVTSARSCDLRATGLWLLGKGDDTLTTRALRSQRLDIARLGAGLAALLTTSVYGPHSDAPLTGAGAPVSGAWRSVTASVSLADMATTSVPFQLHMDFFSNESHQPSVIDPQMFVSAPGTPAGTGPQTIPHVADVAPTAKTDLPDMPLLAADGTPLGITLSQWTSAAGSLSLTCDSAGKRRSTTCAGWCRQASTASQQEAVVVIWHSDRTAHGASGGTLGVDWHNSLIAKVP